MDIAELLRAFLSFQRAWTEAAVAVVPKAWGVITRGDPYPRIYTANMARVDRRPGEGPDRILADMDEVFAGTPVRFRSVVFEDAQEAFEVQEAFVGMGFQPTAALVMARLGLPSCIVNPDVEVRPAGPGGSEADFRAITRAIHEESGYPAEVHEQLYALDRTRAALVGMQDFVAYLDGEPAGTVSLWPRGAFAVVDNVATHPGFRMRGVGRTMIFDACQRAIAERCEWILLTTNAAETPQMMYKTLGFQPIGEVRGFQRD